MLVRMVYIVLSALLHIFLCCCSVSVHLADNAFRTSASEISGDVDVLPVYRLIEEQVEWQRLVDHHLQQADAAKQ